MKIEKAVHNMFAIKAKGYQYKACCDKANSNPANGAPITVPSQDMVLGLYYITKIRPTEVSTIRF